MRKRTGTSCWLATVRSSLFVIVFASTVIADPGVGEVIKGAGEGKTMVETQLKDTQYRIISTREGNADSDVPGLYRSKDSGKTWQRLCRAFDFAGPFFVHPKTGMLYAAIRDEWLEPDPQGFLAKHVGFKMVTSIDGKRWKDITPSQGHVALVMAIFQDPKREENACFHVSLGMRSYVFQAADAVYGEWHRYDELKDDMAPFAAAIGK
jgi:hypothetical protein